MKRKNYLICLLTAIILLPIGVQAKDKKKGKKNIPLVGNSNHPPPTPRPMGKAILKNILSSHP